MALDFPGQEEAMRRTLEVAERCTVEIELGRILLPTFPTPDDRDAFEYLVELCEKGLARRYETVTPELQDRLRFELKTIREMGFADYFLIVQDFVGFAKRNGVGVGPGRGSAAGSIAAYSLGITDLDPIRYGLLFERFLNPGRKSMPDIDIDFAVEGRERVINYVAEKYGRDRVAQIITFGTMAARAAVRDAGRVLEIPYGVVDKIAKLIPEGPGQTLDECLKPGAELKTAYEADPVAKEIVDLAKPLEGLVRQDSIHAAGVVIGAEPLMNLIPLQQKGGDQEVVTQFGMNDVEALGLLKMDFLGLRNLDVIDTAVGLVGGGLDISTIAMDDRRTYEMLARGEATGVFQFESSGMREALRQVKPTEFEDLIALVALYRPGPMAYIPVYARRKHGQEAVTYADPRLKPLTQDSYGICIYQEQYMQIAKEIAGFSPAEADDLRKAIGKKIHALMASLKDKFLEGCAQNGVTPARRDAALEGHGAGAGLLLQQVPRRLLRADRLPDRLAEGEPPVRVHGRADLVRDEHEGQGPVLRQRVRRDRDRGAAAGRELVADRLRRRRGEDPLRPQRGEGRRRGRGARDHHGPGRGRARSRSIWDFTERVDPQCSNKRVLEALVKCGGLDSTGASRQGMLAVLEQALAFGNKQQADRLAGQSSIFDLGDPVEEESAPRHHPAVPSGEFDKNDLLRMEKEVLGLYVSEHPLHAIRDQLRRKTDAAMNELERRRDGEWVTVGGIVSAVKQLTTKKGEPMVFLRLDDVTGSAEVVVFNSVYAASRHLCVTDQILVIKGRVDHKQEGETKLLAQELTPFDLVPEKREVRLRVDASKAPAGIVRELKSLLQDFPGDAPVFVDMDTRMGRKSLEFGPKFRVAPNSDFSRRGEAPPRRRRPCCSDRVREPDGSLPPRVAAAGRARVVGLHARRADPRADPRRPGRARRRGGAVGALDRAARPRPAAGPVAVRGRDRALDRGGGSGGGGRRDGVGHRVPRACVRDGGARACVAGAGRAALVRIPVPPRGLVAPSRVDAGAAILETWTGCSTRSTRSPARRGRTR